MTDLTSLVDIGTAWLTGSAATGSIAGPWATGTALLLAVIARSPAPRPADPPPRPTHRHPKDRT